MAKKRRAQGVCAPGNGGEDQRCSSRPASSSEEARPSGLPKHNSMSHPQRVAKEFQ